MDIEVIWRKSHCKHFLTGQKLQQLYGFVARLLFEFLPYLLPFSL
jgi:hypothetical protein